MTHISGFVIWSHESLEARTILRLSLETSINEDRVVTWCLQTQAKAVLYFIVLEYIMPDMCLRIVLFRTVCTYMFSKAVSYTSCVPGMV